MATYVNDLRLTELATGEGSGTWGTTTNTNLELIGEALGYGTQDCFASDADATTTVADGATDPARAMYFKVTSSATLTATRTLTIAPNTVSRVMLIENATTGSQSIAISQGTGGNVTIASGQTKMVYLDGAGSGAAVVDALADLELGTITVANLTATTADINGGTIDGATIGGASAAAGTFTTLNATGGGSLTGTWSDLGTVTTVDINGGTIDGATIATSDITVGSGKTLDVSAGTFTVANDQISGDAINGGTATPTTLTSTTVNATTVDTTNIEVTNLKAKDGTAAGSIADATGVVTLSSSVLTTTDINGGNIDGTIIGAATPAAGSFTTGQFGTSLNVDGTVTSDGLTVDGNAKLTKTPAFSGGITLTLEGSSASANDLLGQIKAETTTALNSDNPASIRFYSSGTTGGHIGGYISFFTNPESSGGEIERTRISEVGVLSHIGAAIFNEDGGDNNFRVESDSNTHMLFVDAGNDRVGIGTSSPGTALEVAGNSATTGPSLRLSNLADIINAGGVLGTIEFYTGDNSGGGDNVVASIQAITEQTSPANESAILFKTRASGSSNTEAMRITYDGRLGVGTSTPAAKLSVDGSAIFNDSGSDADFRVESDNNSQAIFVDAGNDKVSLANNTNIKSSTSTNFFLDSTTFSSDMSPVWIRNRPVDTDAAKASFGINTAIDGRFDSSMARIETNSSGMALIFANSSVGNATGQIRHVTTGGTEADVISFTATGVSVNGSFSKGSGSFKIDHPVKPDTHHLVHSFVEAPQADNIYRGKAELVDGAATVNIDAVAGMTEGTFALLNREVQCFTSNESGWTAVRGKVDGNILTIEAQDPACTDTISWLVVGERQDQHMYDTDWTDENGKVIVEPLKKTEGA